MAEVHGPGHRRAGYDRRLRGRLGEFYGVDRKLSGIFVGERLIDGRLKGHFGHGTFERDADIGRRVHGADGLRLHARHHEAARTLGCGGHLGKGAVIVGGRLLHQSRKGCAGLGRRGVVVRNGVERALGACCRFGKREGRRLGRELRRGEVPADDKGSAVVEGEDRERRERGFPRLGLGRSVEERAGVGLVRSGERDGDPCAVGGLRQRGVDCAIVFVARGEQGGGYGGRSKKNLFHRVIRN